MLARYATRPPDVPCRSVPASRALLPVTLGVAASGLLLGCGTPGVRGVAGTAPAPNVLWTPPPPRQAAAARAAAPPELPPDLAGRVAQLKLADVIDIALRNNTATSASWADARSAAASYGAARGQYYPTLTINGTGTALKTVPSNVPVSLTRRFYGATVNLSWLLLDFGGRSGSIGVAREALLAADWTHNATLQSLALARVSIARSQALPSLSVGGNAGETHFVNNTTLPTFGNSYTATVTLSIPLFSGGAQIYNVKAAAAAADAAAQRTRGFEQQVVYQVFNAYYALRTATQQVRTSTDLLASATQSEQVALGRYRAGAGSLP